MIRERGSEAVFSVMAGVKRVPLLEAIRAADVPNASAETLEATMNTVEEWKQEKHPLEMVELVEEFAEEGLSFDEIEEREGEGVWERMKWTGMYTHGVQRGYIMMRT